MKRRNPNMRPNRTSKSSRKIVNASRDSVTKNQRRSYKRWEDNLGVVDIWTQIKANLYFGSSQGTEKDLLCDVCTKQSHQEPEIDENLSNDHDERSYGGR
jgi:hypothetical protein